MISSIYSHLQNALTGYDITLQKQVDEQLDSFPRIALYFVDESSEAAVSNGVFVGGVDRLVTFICVCITDDAIPMSAVSLAEDVRDKIVMVPSSDNKTWVTIDGCPVGFEAPMIQGEQEDTDTNLAVAILTITASYRRNK